MKAILHSRYGPPERVLSLGEIDRPDPALDEALVRVHAASVHPDVWHVVTGRPFVLRLMGAGLLRPKEKVPGTDVAGVVESVGGSVTRFQPGDEVFGETVRGMQWRNGGAFAEYVSVPEAVLALKPARLAFEQAAAVPTSGMIALSGVRDQGKVQPGQRVLVNGAGGGVGVFAVQLAKAFGAQVTGVDASGKLEMLRSIGADHVIDHEREDFTQRGERYDLILDVPGNHSFRRIRRVLTPDGTYVLIGHDQYGAVGRRWLGSIPKFFRLLLAKPFVGHLPDVNFSTPDKEASMAVLSGLIEEGKLTPVVDRTFPLGGTVEAIQYLASGRARGKVVVTV